MCTCTSLLFWHVMSLNSFSSTVSASSLDRMQCHACSWCCLHAFLWCMKLPTCRLHSRSRRMFYQCRCQAAFSEMWPRLLTDLLLYSSWSVHVACVCYVCEYCSMPMGLHVCICTDSWDWETYFLGPLCIAIPSFQGTLSTCMHVHLSSTMNMACGLKTSKWSATASPFRMQFSQEPSCSSCNVLREHSLLIISAREGHPWAYGWQRKNVHRLFMLVFLWTQVWLRACLHCLHMFSANACVYPCACVAAFIACIAFTMHVWAHVLAWYLAYFLFSKVWMVAACLVDSPLSLERGLECVEPKLALCILCPVLGTNTACLSMRGQVPPSTRFVCAVQVASTM